MRSRQGLKAGCKIRWFDGGPGRLFYVILGLFGAILGLFLAICNIRWSRQGLTLLSLKVDPIFSFLEARGTQGGPGGPRGKPGKGYPGLPGGPLAFPWVPLALPG